MTDFTGTAGNDDFTGTEDADTFDMTQGGRDTVRGLGGDDSFNFGAELRDTDRIFGGDGTDGLILAGDYGSGVVFSKTNFKSVEQMLLFGDELYHFGFEDSAVADGKTLEIDIAFGVGRLALFSLETTATFDVFAGNGDDIVAVGGGNDIISTLDGADFIAPGAGHDTVDMGDDIDRITFQAGELDRQDRIEGGDTVWTNTVALDGDYSGGVTLSEFTLSNISVIEVTPGNDYDVDFGKTHLRPAGMLVNAEVLAAENHMDVDFSRVIGGSVSFLGGAGDDSVVGSGLGDLMTGNLGKDSLEGGLGNDAYVYDDVAQSTGKNHDTIVGFDTETDIFILSPGFDAVAGIDPMVKDGALSSGTFDKDLKRAVGADELAAFHAVVFKPDDGGLDGNVYLILDANGVAGYQKEEDLVVQLNDASHLADLDVSDFFIV